MTSPNDVDVNLSLHHSESDDEHHTQIAKKLKNRNSTNLSRKFTHAAFGIFFACLNQFLPRTTFVPAMGLLTSATLLMELLRYNRGFGWMNKALHFFLGSSLRKHEMEGKFTGSFYYFAGVYVTAKLFPRTAATMGILQLALADPSASYFGKKTRHVYWSRIENGLGGFGRNKGLLGFLGGALFCFPFNYRVFKIARWGVKGIPGGERSLVLVSLLLGLAGAFADLAVPTPALTMPKKVLGVPVPPFHVDDNFVVPIVAGFACTKIFDLVGWDSGLELAKHIIF
jgi:dolichol kinase